MLGALKVMMKVLVFLLLPESSLTVMFVMSETPWGFSAFRVSCLSQSTSGPHRMTPLHEFRVLWGLAVTGQPARLSSLLTMRLWVAEETSRRKSPFLRDLIVLTVPTALRIALSRMNGESFETTNMEFNGARDDGMVLASAGPYANHMQLAPDR